MAEVMDETIDPANDYRQVAQRAEADAERAAHVAAEAAANIGGDGAIASLPEEGTTDA